jgi:hypothetical protein
MKTSTQRDVRSHGFDLKTYRANSADARLARNADQLGLVRSAGGPTPVGAENACGATTWEFSVRLSPQVRGKSDATEWEMSLGCTHVSEGFPPEIAPFSRSDGWRRGPGLTIRAANRIRGALIGTYCDLLRRREGDT